MGYVDGVVYAVPTANKEEFRKMGQRVAGAFLDNGALEVVDCWGDEVPEGKLTSLPMAVKCGSDETVAMGWIVWPSKEVRNAGWEKVMQDPRMAPTQTAIFDGKRMIFGAFELLNKSTSEG